jgi:glycosyltransferase involved in cell wall biosynthesis
MNFNEYRKLALEEGWFDPDFFLGQMVANSIPLPEEGSKSLLEYYHEKLFSKGLSTSASFSGRKYLAQYPDVREAGVDPLYHYLVQGRYEGRQAFAHEADQDTDKVKPIAFYLPQYHPIPENDKIWGEGFTEWTNVTRATPKFIGHNQPYLPSELGFYDLRVPEIRRKQEALAKQYGIHGFCYYYYSFNGRKVLQTPLELKLQDSQSDLPFMICWANENWTKRWDGHENEIIIAQDHNKESDFNFIHEVMPILKDKRYIRANGKPVIMIYRPELLESPRETFDLWRQAAEMEGLGGLHICGVRFQIEEAEKYGLDALVEFAPHHLPASELSPKQKAKIGVGNSFTGKIIDLEEGVDRLTLFGNGAKSPIHPGVMTSWDNTARRGDGATIYVPSDPKLYSYWLAEASSRTLDEGNFVFINAWNEWAEGACLEPSEKFGRRFLEATSNVVKANEKGNHALQELSVWMKEIMSCQKNPVVFVSHDAEWGGAQLLLTRLMDALQEKEDVECFLLLLKGGALADKFSEKYKTVNVEKFTDLGWEEKETIEFIASRLRRRKDVVALCNTVASGDAAEILASKGVELLSYVHELPTSIEMYEAGDKIKKIAANSKRIITVSKAVQAELASAYAIPKGDIEVIYCGMRRQNPPQYNKRELEQKYNLPHTKYLVLGCGMAHYRKGTDLFVQMAADLVKGKKKEDYLFVWLGGDQTNDGARKWAMHDARRFGLEGQMHFLGQIKDANAFMKEADVFVLTSREDPYPLVVLEAIEHDTPVVCFEGSGGAPEVVNQGAGVCVPYLNIQEMADAVDSFITSEESVGSVAKQNIYIRESLSWEKYVSNMNDRLLSLTSSSVAVIHDRSKAKIEDLCVVIPSYNHRDFVVEALESVLSQSVRPKEIRIIDDGSTDGSAQMLAALHNEKYGIFVHSRDNMGAHTTINQGVYETGCKYVAVLNSDDRYHKLRFETLINKLEASGADGIFSRVRYMNEAGKLAGKEAWYEEAVSYLKSGMPLWLSVLRKNSFMTTSNLLMKREKFIEIGGFNAYRYCHDLDFILRACGKGIRLHFEDANLMDYRFHSSNTISENKDRLEIEEAYLIADFLNSYHPKLNEEETHFLFEALEEKNLSGLVISFLDYCHKYSTRFDYMSIYDERVFNDAASRGKSFDKVSFEEFRTNLETPLYLTEILQNPEEFEKKYSDEEEVELSET